jgi:hypothetical protein
MHNQIIVRFAEGKILKGTTVDLFPNKTVFHLKEKESGVTQEINVSLLKAIYFVKYFDGDPNYQEKVDGERANLGRKIKVEFNDGETLLGYTQGYTPNRDIFIVFPVDADSNNEKVFVVTKSTRQVSFI